MSIKPAWGCLCYNSPLINRSVLVKLVIIRLLKGSPFC